jgi:hypothetical protein
VSDRADNLITDTYICHRSVFILFRFGQFAIMLSDLMPRARSFDRRLHYYFIKRKERDRSFQLNLPNIYLMIYIDIMKHQMTSKLINLFEFVRIFYVLIPMILSV